MPVSPHILGRACSRLHVFALSVCPPQVFQDIEDLQVAARRKQGDVATAANKAVAADIDAFLKSI